MPSIPMFRSAIQQMTGYVPGEQPAAGAKVIKLNTNENPYPCSPKVTAAIRHAAESGLAEVSRSDGDGISDAGGRGAGC